MRNVKVGRDPRLLRKTNRQACGVAVAGSEFEAWGEADLPTLEARRRREEKLPAVFAVVRMASTAQDAQNPDPVGIFTQ